MVVGCGQQSFMAGTAVETALPPGNLMVPAKVDILLVEDDTGSMFEAYDQISQQMPAFLSQLQTMGWDYNFATIPLTTPRALNQVVGSIYDPNWALSQYGDQWVAPFPGATTTNTEEITPSLFSTPGNYEGFLSMGNISDADDGMEPGFQNITNELYEDTNGTGFLRKDAMLVILDIGNGNDTSLVNFCPRLGDGIKVPCEETTQANGAPYPQCTDISQAGVANPTCASSQISMEYYQQLLTNIKGSASMVQFYSAVSNENTYPNTCLGGYASQGSRYQQMSAMMGGQTYDICNGGTISDALTNMSTSLQNEILSMQTQYLPISQDANINTIVVTRNDGTVIPECANDLPCADGWTYTQGVQVSGYIIDYPVDMDYFTGYAVKLNGTAQLTGTQSATVSYTPAGLQNSAATRTER